MRRLNKIQAYEEPKTVFNQLISIAADALRKFLPVKARNYIYQLVSKEKIEYPLIDPILAEVAGIKAKFWIKNQSDWYRIARTSFEDEFSNALIECVKNINKAVFVDVGAAQGYYSILAAKAGSNVIAIDPDPISLRSLESNIELNPEIKQQVKIMGVALADEDGEVILNIDTSGSYAPSIKKTTTGLSQKVTVPMTTLDAVLLDNGLPIPQVVKIDVEGAEGKVVQGMQKILALENKPTDIFIELHRKYLPLFGSDEFAVEKDITTNGYHLKECWERKSVLLCHYKCD